MGVGLADGDGEGDALGAPPGVGGSGGEGVTRVVGDPEGEGAGPAVQLPRSATNVMAAVNPLAKVIGRVMFRLRHARPGRCPALPQSDEYRRAPVPGQPQPSPLVGADLDSDEFAATLGTSPSAARIRLSRAVDRLRQELRDA